MTEDRKLASTQPVPVTDVGHSREAPTGQGYDPSNEALLRVISLTKYFPIRGGILHRAIAQVRAVDSISFDINRGETLGLVGESGCGKTTVARLILRLIEPTKGQIVFDGHDVTKANGRELKRLRRNVQIVFQDPYGSLDPRMPVGEIIAEPLAVHGVGDKREREHIVQETMTLVGLHSRYARRYPHEFSGGQRQRICIARALVLRPKLVVCDEPVSALDVSIQSQILNLLNELKDRYGLTYLFIAHNLAVVKYISDRVAVMYLGKIVELAQAEELYSQAQHPYTKALLAAIPQPDPRARPARQVLKGDVPSPIDPPAGCRFHTRCPLAQDICSEIEPELRNIGGEHWVSCHLIK